MRVLIQLILEAVDRDSKGENSMLARSVVPFGL
jgi:hypothetical protein